MPCPFAGPKMFWAGPNFLCQTKNLFTCCARKKDNLNSVKLFFVLAQQFLEEALNAVKFLGWLKKIWTGTKHFGTCKRTRHQCLLSALLDWFKNCFTEKQHSLYTQFVVRPKLYIPSTLNITLIQWHTQLNVCAVK